MLFTALLVVCCTAATLDTPAAATNSPAPITVTTASHLVHELPDAPLAKSATVSTEDNTSSSSENVSSAPSILNSPIKPAARAYETARQRKIWYGLIVASHSSAGFDAWSTRRALSGGYGTEADPLMRPFAHSGAIYAATQVSPLVMDYLGYRMMNSHNSFMRKMWWVPQVAGTSVSLSAGIHNYRLAH